MRLTDRVKPISYVKANASALLRDITNTGLPVVITQNGEATAIVQDIASFERTQETLALLKLLAMGQEDIDAGRVVAARDVVDRLRARAPR